MGYIWVIYGLTIDLYGLETTYLLGCTSKKHREGRASRLFLVIVLNPLSGTYEHLFLGLGGPPCMV